MPYFNKTLIALLWFAITFLTSCKNHNDQQRAILLIPEWHITSVGQDEDSNTNFQTTINLEINKNNLYFLRLIATDSIIDVFTNQTEVGLSFSSDSAKYYNLTTLLITNKPNSIGFIVDKQAKHLTEANAFNAQVVCVNKLFIPDFCILSNDINNNSPQLNIDIKVKNSFESEKQGIIRCRCLNNQNKLLGTSYSPFFIERNSENIFHKTIPVKLLSESNIRIECEIISDNRTIDINTKTIRLNTLSQN